MSVSEAKLRVAVADELVFERLVIFDYAVVDEGEAARRVEMRVRVLIGRFPVRGPAGVADAEGAGRRPLRHEFSELGNSAGAFARLNLVAVHDRDAGGVVAAIFQTPQTIQEDRGRLGAPDVTDYATHGESVTLSERGRNSWPSRAILRY